MKASPHHVAGEQRDVVGEAVRDLPQGQIGVRGQHLLCLGALKGAKRRAVPVDPSLVALVELLAPAEEALAAGGPVGAEDAVADRDPADVVAGGDHLADELVADHEARLDLHPAVVDVEVRAADPAGLDTDNGVVRRQKLGLGNVVQLDLAGGLECDRAHD